MIVCRDVLLADSYATAWANRVRTEEDTGSVVERACRVPEILGAMAVKGERLAVGGTVANYARKDDTLRSIRM